MSIIIGPVKPWTYAAYKEIQAKFPCQSVYGNPSTGFPDHLAGLALDFMVFDDRAKGDAIAAYAIANYQRLDIGYVIWYQRIWYPSRGQWTPMPDRHSVNLNHMNHVHINFKATPPTGGPVVDATVQNVSSTASNNPIDGLTNIAGALENGVKAIQWITDPHNLGRVAMVILGAILILVTIDRAGNASQTITKVVKNASAKS